MPGESAGQQAERKRRNLQNMQEERRLLDERIQRQERDAEMWARGHAGEQTVGAQLDLLRTHGFEVFHDVHWPGRKRANIDHIAVGPPGILVVDAKNWSGRVSVRDGVLRQNGYGRDKEVAGAKQAGDDVGALLQLPWALHVIPVIALAGAGAGGVHHCQGVAVVDHDQLVAWATGLPPRLTPDDVRGIASHLRGAMPPATGPLQVARRPRSYGRPPVIAREPSARERKRMAKRAAARRELLLRLAAIAFLLLLAPTLLTWWQAHGNDVVRGVIPTPTVALATPTAAPAVPIFISCRTLRAAYPDGVKRIGARNTGRKARGHMAADDAVYRANRRLDQDKDGIACERTQTKGRHKG
jgi:hypothetical protein